MSQPARRALPTSLPSALRLGLPAGLVVAALMGAAAAQPGPLPPGAAATAGDNSSVGSDSRVPNVAYPQSPADTPAAEGADRARPPTAQEKAEQRLR